MKNTLLALFLFSSFNLIAQIPDSLEVSLPWEVIELSSCAATMGEGPHSDNETVDIFLASDVVQYNASDQCQFRTKVWEVLDWVGGNTYSFTQIGSPSELVNTTCENEIYLHFDDFPVNLTPDDLLLDLDPTHDYSFSFSNPMDELRVVNVNSGNSFELFVYDFTDNSICKSNVFVTQCEDEIELIFPEIVDINFNGEPYIELTTEMLGVSIVYPCDTYTTKIRINNQSNGILSSSHVGKVISANVELKLGDGTKYKKDIDINVTGFKPDPKVMYIEEKSFVAGETIELDVWSEGIAGIVAWQLQLEFEDVEVLGIQASETFADIPSNVIEEEVLRALWTPLNGMAIDAESDATWFTIELKPDSDGSTFDIFKEMQDNWSLIAVEDDDYIYEFEVEYTFNVAPRDILGIDDKSHFTNIDVYPNPTTNELIISGLPNSNLPIQVEIIDMEGKMILQKKYSNLNSPTIIDISEIPPGIFVLRAQNEETIATQKITKI